MYISAARLAHMYYEEGLTQQQIATELGISRVRVSRLLQQAREDGVVRIEISYEGYHGDLERQISERFPRVRAIVADGLDGSTEQRVAASAATAAQYIDTLVGADVTVAVGWGRTLLRVVEYLVPSTVGGTYAPIIGGQGYAALDLHSTQLADRMARAKTGHAFQMLAPAMTRTMDAHGAMMSTPTVAEAIDAAEHADVALFSVGAPFAPDATLLQTGYLTKPDIDLLRAENVRCDVISLAYLDNRGQEVAKEVSARAVALTSNALHAIPCKVLVAAGRDKVEAIVLALSAGFADVLVTDDRTATELLNREAVVAPASIE